MDQDNAMETVLDPPASGKATKPKRDYRKLREHQLEISRSDKFREKGGQIRDDNPPARWLLNGAEVPKDTPGAVIAYYQDRTYEQLAKIKMPMILSLINDENGNPRKDWTIDEILQAMQPPIVALSGQYSRKRAAFQMDEAESLGKEAVLTALWTDLGLAWFAGYCYEKIEAAIRRGAQTSGTIRASERRREYRDKVQSTDSPIGEGDGTIAETIRDSLPFFRRERCGDYYQATIPERVKIIKEAVSMMKLDIKLPDIKPGVTKADEQDAIRRINEHLKSLVTPDQFKEIETYLHIGVKSIDHRCTKGASGTIFVYTCKGGLLPSGETCDRCGGTTRIIVYEERTVRTPAELAAENIRMEDFRKVWRELIQDLTPKQLEILELKEGLDEEGGGRKRDATEVAAILKERNKREIEESYKVQKDRLTESIKTETDQAKIAALQIQLDSVMITLASPIVGMGSKNRVSQVLDVVYRKIRERQAQSKDLTEAIDRILDLDEND